MSMTSSALCAELLVVLLLSTAWPTGAAEQLKPAPEEAVAVANAAASTKLPRAWPVTAQLRATSCKKGATSLLWRLLLLLILLVMAVSKAPASAGTTSCSALLPAQAASAALQASFMLFSSHNRLLLLLLLLPVADSSADLKQLRSSELTHSTTPSTAATVADAAAITKDRNVALSKLFEYTDSASSAVAAAQIFDCLFRQGVSQQDSGSAVANCSN
jgi:hypothetical protein